MESFKLFSKFSGLKPYILKYDVAGVSLRGVKMTVNVIKWWTDLTTETLKIWSVHFSNIEKLQIQKNL